MSLYIAIPYAILMFSLGLLFLSIGIDMFDEVFNEASYIDKAFSLLPPVTFIIAALSFFGLAFKAAF